MRGQLRTCPECGSRNVRRTHRKNLFERTVLSLLWLRPFRCNDCDRRFTGIYSGQTVRQAREKPIMQGPNKSRAHA
jgi:transposase